MACTSDTMQRAPKTPQGDGCARMASGDVRARTAPQILLWEAGAASSSRLSVFRRSVLCRTSQEEAHTARGRLANVLALVV